MEGHRSFIPVIAPALSIVALLAVIISPAPAWAHAFLDHSEPRVGATVSQSPAVLTLVFTEPIEPAFSHVEVLGDAGERIDTGAVVHPEPASLTVALPSLAPGRYAVVWSVVSVDTHATDGRFTFTVASP
jgi:methionine-rich copper-binding protein CopC